MVMTDEQIRDYAVALIEEHATDVEWLSVFEVWESYQPRELPDGDEEISEDDAVKVHDLVRGAKITVTFAGEEQNR